MAIIVLTACSFVFFYCSPFRAGLEPRASHMQGRAPLVGYILKPLCFAQVLSNSGDSGVLRHRHTPATSSTPFLILEVYS